MSTRQRHGHEASIVYAKRDGRRFHWHCKHVHRTEAGAFGCGTREVRRRFATARPRSDLAAFNLAVNPVLREAGTE
jgi:hypothetical protein